MNGGDIARNVVFIVHYFPPINSSGAKRAEAMAKYFVRAGRNVTVITTRKTGSDGAFTEIFPEGVKVLQLDCFGRNGDSVEGNGVHEPMYTGRPSLKRRIKEKVMDWFGQLPDPRLPFSFSFLSPWLDPAAKEALRSTDIVIGSCPPWPMLLAPVFIKWRFRKPIVLDYRDHFSECHEMPGSKFAKAVEKLVDVWLIKRADRLVTISAPMAQYYSQFHNRVSVILNGYDPEALELAKQRTRWDFPKGRSLTIRYLGIVSPGRVPRNLLRALKTIASDKDLPRNDIRFEYYGNGAVLQKVLQAEYSELEGFFHFYPAVSYNEALQLMVNADYLLFCETSTGDTLSAQGILTTKLFEYVGSGRPVLADIAPDTLAGSTLKKAGQHHFVTNDSEAFCELFSSEKFWKPVESVVTPFAVTLSRAAQAEEYLQLLDECIHEERR